MDGGRNQLGKRCVDRYRSRSVNRVPGKSVFDVVTLFLQTQTISGTCLHTVARRAALEVRVKTRTDASICFCTTLHKNAMTNANPIPNSDPVPNPNADPNPNPMCGAKNEELMLVLFLRLIRV